jgi:hypothetical protein
MYRRGTAGYFRFYIGPKIPRPAITSTVLQ